MAPVHRKRKDANFLSLPREIRDVIYKELVVSLQPVHYTRRTGPIVCDIDANIIHHGLGVAQITMEALEVFFRQNSFSVFDDDLSSFLNSSVTSWVSPDLANAWWRCGVIPEQHVGSCITEIGIFQQAGMLTDYEALEAGLCRLSACPRLRMVVIETGPGFWRMLGDKAKMAFEELQTRLGEGLKIRMQGSGYSSALEYPV